MTEQTFSNEIKKGERFEFGKNWAAFLKTLTEERIQIAMDSLTEMLCSKDLAGKSFLDVGCGSGLFSLAAVRLGATAVYSFDFDPNSVKCTQILKKRYFPQSKWIIEEGSILDKEYLKSLEKFDIVYSWGVLHHTGDLYGAMDNIDTLVNEKGKLFIAIYNDQGNNSLRWRRIKKIYNSGLFGKISVVSVYIPYFVVRGFFADILRLRNPFKRYRDYKTQRGMSMFYDWFDWLGGLPFQVASPETVFGYFKKKRYSLLKLKTTISLGCNEFVFEKN